MWTVLSVNVGKAMPTEHSTPGVTGIDKHPVEDGADLSAPGPRGAVTMETASGVAGDVVCDVRDHGGVEQAVYAYAREDLDEWAAELGRELPGGSFGENLTTSGVDLGAVVMGDRWLVGDEDAGAVLEVTVPRIPCRTFAGWLEEKGWVRRFTERGRCGTYFRVVRPGRVRPGDSAQLLHRPDHGVTIELAFRALTGSAELLPRLLAAGVLPERERVKAERRVRSAG